MKEIELLGHMAKIESIKAVQPDTPWTTEENYQIWLDFGKNPVGDTIAFGISLPISNYTPEEFLALVKHEGERHLKESLAHSEKAKLERVKKENRQKDLDILATRLTESLEK